MPLLRALSPHRPLVLALLLSSLAVTTSPPTAQAARAVSEVGLRLLKAQIPADASLRRLNCEQLSKAVHAATLDHRTNAVQVLVAGLSLPEWDARRKKEFRLECPCVIHIFNAAATAAPERAAILLETAQALYPECAEGLTAALSGLERRIIVAALHDGKDGVGSGADADPGRGSGFGNSSGADADPGDGSGFGNGAGLGPGFPGSPGFGGSAPSGGGISLPQPIGGAVTVVVNN